MPGRVLGSASSDARGASQEPFRVFPSFSKENFFSLRIFPPPTAAAIDLWRHLVYLRTCRFFIEKTNYSGTRAQGLRGLPSREGFWHQTDPGQQLELRGLVIRVGLRMSLEKGHSFF